MMSRKRILKQTFFVQRYGIEKRAATRSEVFIKKWVEKLYLQVHIFFKEVKKIKKDLDMFKDFLIYQIIIQK